MKLKIQQQMQKNGKTNPSKFKYLTMLPIYMH